MDRRFTKVDDGNRSSNENKLGVVLIKGLE
jgi:hypothetical protein